MKKNVFLFLFVFFSLFACSYFNKKLEAQTLGSSLSLLPADVQVNVGDNFTLSVNINTHDDSVTAAELHLTYDPAILQATSITAGTFLSVTLSAGQVGTGSASITLGSGTTPKTGTSTLATVIFKALAASTAQVNFADTTQVAAVGKTTNSVSSMTGSQIVIGTNTISLTPSPTVPPYPTTSAVLPTIPPNLPNNCYTRQYGDADCDGKADDKDFELWKQEVTMNNPVGYSDFFPDGKIDLADFEIWRRYTTGMSIPAPTPSPLPSPTVAVDPCAVKPDGAICTVKNLDGTCSNHLCILTLSPTPTPILTPAAPTPTLTPTPTPRTAFTAAGGTITVSGGYTIHTFTSNGTFTPNTPGNVEYLVVAGGGGGGDGHSSQYGGGGGAGGLLTGTGFAVLAQAYPITVGGGGAAAPNGNTTAGSDGGNSVFSTITAVGGGGGGTAGGLFLNGRNGGSGGGVAWLGTIAGTGISGQGFAGSTYNAYGAAGGGGGSLATTTTTAPGAGTVNSISGSSVTYAAGGGSGYNGASTANSGNGGNSEDSTRNGQAGGSGIVIIRYLSGSQ